MEHIFTDANFEEEVLKSPIPVVVDFWAPWCQPCRIMGPIVEAVAGEIDVAKCKIGKMNIDEHGQFPQKYGIMSIPTLLVFKNGEVVETQVGVVDKETLKAVISKHVA